MTFSALLETFAAAPSLSPPASVDGEHRFLRLGRRCMATQFEILLPFGTPNALAQAEAGFDLLDALEAQLTVYRDSSEVSHLNRHAFAQSVRVDNRLFELLRIARELAEQTDGAFDFTCGALIQAWGYLRGPRRVPSASEIKAAVQQVGWRQVCLEQAVQSIRFRRPGLLVNFGSIGKGFALDCWSRWLEERQTAPNYLIHGGFSSILARGFPANEPQGWPIDICHPWHAQQKLARVWLRNQALATSAATYQHLEYEGRKLGHILDPRSGWPAAGIASASVVAPTAAEADALSTAIFVGGVELARSLCTRRPELGAIVLTDEGASPFTFGVCARGEVGD